MPPATWGSPKWFPSPPLVTSAPHRPPPRPPTPSHLSPPACARCPSLILVNGEDLSPYREASRSIFAVLSRFGTLERLGLDEAVVDLTAEVAARVRLGIFCRQFSGHVVGESDASDSGEDGRGGEERMMVGSEVAAEIRAAVERETGYRCSCGISHNVRRGASSWFV